MRLAPLALAGLLTLALTTSAHAGPKPAVFDGILDACLGGGSWGKVATVERLGSLGDTPIYHATMEKKGKRVLFFGAKAEGCQVYPVGRAMAGAYGHYLGDGQRLRAFLVGQNEGTCDLDTCDAAVVVRNDKKEFLSVGRIEGCNEATAKTVRLFGTKHDSLAVECTSTGGGDMLFHRAVLVHAEGKRVHTALDVPLGYSQEEPGVEEGKTCRSGPAGNWEVTTKGAEPVVTAFEVEDDGADGTLNMYRWDRKAHAFVKAGAGAAHTGANKTVCK